MPRAVPVPRPRRAHHAQGELIRPLVSANLTTCLPLVVVSCRGHVRITLCSNLILSIMQLPLA
jgi:hypothetical protein